MHFLHLRWQAKEFNSTEKTIEGLNPTYIEVLAHQLAGHLLCHQLGLD